MKSQAVVKHKSKCISTHDHSVAILKIQSIIFGINSIILDYTFIKSTNMKFKKIIVIRHDICIRLYRDIYTPDIKLNIM